MRRSVGQSVLVGISTVMSCAQAWAEPLRLEERIAPGCVAAARDLGPRLEHTLGASVSPELQASVAIDALGQGYRVTIALSDAAETRGATVIELPTCDEAVDAAVVVLALAIDETARSEAAEPVATRLEPAAISPRETRAVLGAERASADRLPVMGAEHATRLALATGVDAGTLPQPTLTLAGAVARSIGGLELSAVARYGLPIADEMVETGYSESQRHDFGGLELRACRGVGRAVRLSACGGTEVGAVRARSAVQGEDRTDVDQERISPRVSGTLAALVAHRGGLIEPELELAGAAVALGRDAGAPWLVMRVAAGAAIAF